MRALENRKLRTTVIVFTAVVLLLLVSLAYNAFIAKAEESGDLTEITSGYYLLVSDDPFAEQVTCVAVIPDNPGRSAKNVCLTTGGTTEKVNISQYSNAGPIYDRYWVQIVRKGFFAPDIHCEVLIPDTGAETSDPAISCLVF